MSCYFSSRLRDDTVQLLCVRPGKRVPFTRSNRYTIVRDMKLTTAQLTESIRELVTAGKISMVEKVVVEALMCQERELHNEAEKDVSNGFRPRKMYMMGDTLVLSVPRTRRHEFSPVLLAVLRNKQEAMLKITEKMVSQGSTMEDISAVLEIVFGKRYSTSNISRIATGSKKAIDAWLSRPLPRKAELLMIDATYINTCRETVKKEAYLTAMALYEDGSREVVGVYNNPSEGSVLWQELFEDLKSRGLKETKLVVSDGLAGIEDAAQIAYPMARVQLCTVHLERNLSDIPRKDDRAEFMADFKYVLDVDRGYASPSEARDAFLKVCEKWDKKYHTCRRYRDDPRLILYFTYILYAHHQRRYIHTTNWIERFNRKIKKAVKNKSQMPDPYHGVYLIALVVQNSRHLRTRIPDLIGGLKDLER